MNSIQKAILKNFNPAVSVEIKDIGQGRKSVVLLKKVKLPPTSSIPWRQWPALVFAPWRLTWLSTTIPTVN